MDTDRILEAHHKQADDGIESEARRIDDTLDSIIDKIPQKQYTVYLVFVFGLANAADAIELMSVSYLIPTAACTLRMGSFEKGILSAISFLGMMIGSVLGWYLADKYGRRFSLCLTLLINGAGGLISAFQPTFVPFILFRLLAAVGVGGSIPIVWTYFVEFLPSKRRGLFLNITAISWMIGSVGVAAFALVLIPNSDIRGWRYFTVISSLPAFAAVAFTLSIPESPKYFMLLDKINEAWNVLEYIALKNNALQAITPYKDQFFNYITENERESEILPKDTKKKGYLAIFTSSDKSIKEMRKHMLLLTCIVTLICYGYYGLLMWLPNMLVVMEMNTSKGLCGRITDGYKALQPVINHTKVVHYTDTCHPHRKVYVESMLIAASSLPGNIASTLLIDKIGRKLLLIPCLFICAISVILMMLIKSHVAALLFSCLFSALSVIPFNVLNCIGIELFPTRFRAYSFSTQYMFGRIGAILATVSFGYFLDIYCYLPLLIVAINLIIAGVISCGLKETKGLQIL